MYYYEFTPETQEAPANLQVIADAPEELEEAHLVLISNALASCREGEISREEFNEVVLSSTKDLPISILGKIGICEESREPDIVNNRTNIYMGFENGYPKDFIEKGATVFSIDTPDMKLLSQNDMDLLLSRTGIDCDDVSYTLQVRKTASGDSEVVEHKTYGHTSDGYFVPIVTILNRNDHPARQAAEQSTPAAA